MKEKTVLGKDEATLAKREMLVNLAIEKLKCSPPGTAHFMSRRAQRYINRNSWI